MLKLNLDPAGPTDSNIVYPQPAVSWQSPVLTINNETYDLSLLEDNATASHPELGTVTRTGDDYECTIRLPHGANAPKETRFPEPITVTEDGPIELPIYDIIEEESFDELA